MKKLLTVLAVTLLTATLAQAFPGKFGVVAGYTSSATNIKDATNDFKTASLWHAGVAYKLVVGPVAIQPSVTYNMKGTTIDNVDYKTGYLEASAGVQLGLDLLVARPFLVAEPFIGYQIYGNEAALSDITNKLEYGFGVGVGADVFNRIQLRIQWYKNLGALTQANIKSKLKLSSLSRTLQSCRRSAAAKGRSVPLTGRFSGNICPKSSGRVMEPAGSPS